MPTKLSINNPTLAGQLTSAFNASPLLLQQFNQLADSDLLKGFGVLNASTANVGAQFNSSEGSIIQIPPYKQPLTHN